MQESVNGHQGELSASLLDIPEPTPGMYAAHDRYEKAQRDWYAEQTRYKDMLEGRNART